MVCIGGNKDMKRAIYPGTFDPITLGHLDVIKASATIFDELLVVVMINPLKKPMFSQIEREEMIESVLIDNNLENVRCKIFKGLTTELVDQVKAIAIIRGLRLTTEYEAELNISFNNRILNSNVCTIFVSPLQEHIHISSSAVRELLTFGAKKSIYKYVPEIVINQIIKKDKSNE